MVGKVEKRFLFENPRLDLRVLVGAQPYARLPGCDVVACHHRRICRRRTGGDRADTPLGHLVTPEGILGKHRPSQRPG